MLRPICYLILILMVTLTVTQAQEKHLGGEFTVEAFTPISELIAHPDSFFNRDVKIKGFIASACTNEGCFIEVAPEDGSAEGIVINFAELVHTFPTDCAGLDVTVEGMFYQKIYPSARVLHWQGHSFRKGMPVPDFSLINRMTAKAVTIGTNRRPLLQPDSIHEATFDRINLDAMEFEAEGFGIGKKILMPGDSTEVHSSSSSREIVLCLDGELTIVKPGSNPVTLQANEMSFIPPATKHGIRNNSGKPAVYVFVYARKIEPEEKHDH